MSERVEQLRARIEALRDDFDAALASPPELDSRPVRDLVFVRAGADPLAIPMDALLEVRRIDSLIAVVSSQPSFQGLLGISGDVVAVHDLAALLGRRGGDHHWVAVLRGRAKVGLAVAAALEHARIPEHEVRSQPDGGSALTPWRITGGRRAGCPVLDAAAVQAVLEV